MTNKLVSIITKLAPVLGAILPIPGGALIGQAIANIFGSNDINDPNLPNVISADPNAIIKFKQIESDNQIQIQKILADYATAELLQQQHQNDDEIKDRMDARAANNADMHALDEWIKGYLVLALSVIIFICLWLIDKGNVQGEENNIVMMVLGSSFTALTSIVFFYWGTSFNSQKNQGLMVKK